LSVFIQICAVGSKNASFLHQRAPECVLAVLGFWQFKNLSRHPRQSRPVTFAHPVPSRSLTSIPFWPRWSETLLPWLPGP